MKKETFFDVFTGIYVPLYEMSMPDYDFWHIGEKDPTKLLYEDAYKNLSKGNIQKGKEQLELSYKQGIPAAGHILSYGYAAGWFGQKDYDVQIKILRELIKSNVFVAMYDLAQAYETGKGVKKNTRLAIFWYKKASDGRCDLALTNLAKIYLFGPTKFRNIVKGLVYAFRAADACQEYAHNILGICYEQGIGVIKDPHKAFVHYKDAIWHYDNGEARANLARCYRYGIGTDVDMLKAEELERQAAERGYNSNDVK